MHRIVEDLLEDLNLDCRVKGLNSNDSFVWVLERIVEPCNNPNLGNTYHRVEEVKELFSICRPCVDSLDVDDFVTCAKFSYSDNLRKIIEDITLLMIFTHLD